MSASATGSSSSGRLSLPVLVLVPCGFAFVGGVALSLVRRRRKAQRLRTRHEQKIRLWCEKQEREKLLKEEFRINNVEYCAAEEVGRYRVDVKCAFKLWEDGETLGCDPELQWAIVEYLIPEWDSELQECMEFMDTNFTYDQSLSVIVSQVERTGATQQLMPLWSRVKAVQRKTWRRNVRQFLKLMLVGSRTRVVSMLTTAAFSVGLAQIANSQSCCRDALMTAITSCATFTGEELFALFARDLGMTYLNGVVTFVAESTKDFLVKQSSGEMWRRFYAKLVAFDSEIYERQDVTNYLNLEDSLADAESAIQTFMQCAMDLATRATMIYTRGGFRLTTCVMTFWSVSFLLKRPLDQLRDMLAKCDFLGRHDDDELDQDEEWIDEDAIKEEMRSLFDYIRTVRGFGRDKDIMDSIVKKKFGRPSNSLFGLDEYLGYTFPPIKDWILLSFELLCSLTCSWLLRSGYSLPCTHGEMHILIRETWAALSTAPHSLAPSFVLNHVSQVAAVMNILDYEPLIEKDGGLTPEKLTGSIELRNVSFAYPMRRDRKILCNLSLKAEPGTMTGLVGPSGSGKTTIFGLLMRYYDPTEGQILLDGRDLREYNVRWLRERIGEVNQSTQLFEMSVEDNIRFGYANATREEVVAAAKLANAYKFIMSLPEGFNTILGENAIRLSGGQMQRISISRAFLLRPRILLLDEYSSALDTQSEVEVQQAVQRLVQTGCTVLVIAHRLTTVEGSAQIVVLDRGTCVECGTHAELLKLGGIYTTLHDLQSSNSPDRMDRPCLAKRPSFMAVKRRPTIPEEDESTVRNTSFERTNSFKRNSLAPPSSSPRTQCSQSPLRLFNSEGTDSGYNMSLRMAVANIFEAHQKEMNKLQLLPAAWEAVKQQGDAQEVLRETLNSLAPATRSRLCPDNKPVDTSNLARLVAALVTAGITTAGWLKVVQVAAQIELNSGDILLLRPALTAAARVSWDDERRPEFEEAWNVAFGILGDVVAESFRLD